MVEEQRKRKGTIPSYLFSILTYYKNLEKKSICKQISKVGSFLRSCKIMKRTGTSADVLVHGFEEQWWWNSCPQWQPRPAAVLTPQLGALRWLPHHFWSPASTAGSLLLPSVMVIFPITQMSAAQVTFKGFKGLKSTYNYGPRVSILIWSSFFCFLLCLRTVYCSVVLETSDSNSPGSITAYKLPLTCQ